MHLDRLDTYGGPQSHDTLTTSTSTVLVFSGSLKTPEFARAMSVRLPYVERTPSRTLHGHRLLPPLGAALELGRDRLGRRRRDVLAGWVEMEMRAHPRPLLTGKRILR